MIILKYFHSVRLAVKIHSVNPVKKAFCLLSYSCRKLLLIIAYWHSVSDLTDRINRPLVYWVKPLYVGANRVTHLTHTKP